MVIGIDSLACQGAVRHILGAVPSKTPSCNTAARLPPASGGRRQEACKQAHHGHDVVVVVLHNAAADVMDVHFKEHRGDDELKHFIVCTAPHPAGQVSGLPHFAST